MARIAAITPARNRLTFLFAKRGTYLPDLWAGTETATHGLCVALLQRGHRVAVACLAAPASGRGRPMDLGYPVFRARRLEKALAQARAAAPPDLIVIQEPEAGLIAALSAAVPPPPLLLSFNSVYTSPLTSENLNGLCKGRTVSVLANSAVTQAWLASGGVRSALVPPVFGIDRHLPPAAPGQPRQFEACRSHGADALIVSAQFGKGVDIALRLAEARPRRRFRIVETWGPAQDLARVRRRAARLPNVTLHANTPDMSALFAQTRVLLMPSRLAEGWGRTVSEAQLMGIPVLGSTRGNLPATIGAGGIVLDPDGPFAPWLQAFDSLMKHPDRHEALAQAAFQRGTEVLAMTDSALATFLSAARRHLKRLARD